MKLATTKELTYLANHPRIAPAFGIKDDQHLSLADYYKREGNLAFWSPLGAMMFPQVTPTVYDSHFLFIPGHSGREIKAYARQMLNEMFTRWNARVIRGYPPRENRAVRMLGVGLGYQKIPDADITDDIGRSCETYEIRREQWAIL